LVAVELKKKEKRAAKSKYTFSEGLYSAFTVL